MKLKIEIQMDNAAFEGITARFRNGDEPARILRRLADDVESNGEMESGCSWNLRDVNGNTVGKAKVIR